MLGSNYQAASAAEYLGVSELHHASHSPALYALAEKDWAAGYGTPSAGPLPSSSFIKPSLSPQNALSSQVAAQEFNSNFYAMCPQPTDVVGEFLQFHFMATTSNILFVVRIDYFKLATLNYSENNLDFIV